MNETSFLVMTLPLTLAAMPLTSTGPLVIWTGWAFEGRPERRVVAETRLRTRRACVNFIQGWDEGRLPLLRANIFHEAMDCKWGNPESGRRTGGNPQETGWRPREIVDRLWAKDGNRTHEENLAR